MSYPRNFYYQIKQSEASYGYTPPGDLDVTRFIQNKSYWRKALPKSEEKKKALILADWTAYKWTYKKQNQVKVLLEKLQSDGFQIYIWQEESNTERRKVDKLKCPNKIFISETRNSMTLATSNYISNIVVKKYNLTKDQIFIVDNHWLDALLTQNFNQPRQLELENITPQNRDSIFSILNKAEPAVNAVIHKTFSRAYNARIPDISEKIHIPIVSQYDKIQIRNTDLSELVNKFNLNNVSINIMQLAKIAILDLSITKEGFNENQLDDLITLLSYLKNMKSMILDFRYRPDFSKIIEKLLRAENVNLKSLEEITLANVAINAEDIPIILNTMTGMQAINFFDCEISDAPINGNLNLLLNSLLLPTSYEISMKNLKHLLYYSEPTLDTILDINGKQLESSEGDHLDLAALKRLVLRDTIFSSKLFKRLFGDSNNLQEIILDGGEIGEISSDLNLLSLDTLRINCSSRTGIYSVSASLHSLLDQARNIKKLFLMCEMSEDFINKDLDLSALEICIFNYASTISATNLQRMLASAKNLVILELGKIKDDLKQYLNLPSVERVNIGEISGENFQYLLAQSKNLKELRLEVLTSDFVGDWKFISLESLDLTNSNLSIKQLYTLILMSPNLNFINLSNCNNLPPKEIENLKLHERGITIYDRNKQSNPVESSNQYTLFKKDIANAIQIPLSSKQLNIAPHRSNKSYKVDADTTFRKEKRRQVNQIFWGNKDHPHPRDYRWSAYHHLALHKNPVSIGDAFMLDNQFETRELDLKLISVNPTRSAQDLSQKFLSQSANNPALFYGKLTLNLNKTWQALPSLSLNDVLCEYHLDNPSALCEIKYSQRDNLYYIRSLTNDGIVNMDFLVKCDFSAPKVKIPEKLRQLIDYYSNFNEGEISFKGPGSSQQFLDAINKERKGACRHRTVALMDAIQNNKQNHRLPESISSRCISNDIHAYIEIKLDSFSPWLRFDLGGYATELKINTQHAPQLNREIKNQTQLPIISFDKPEKDNYIEYFEKQLYIDQKKPTIFKSQSAYYFDLCSGKKKKQLIELSSTKEVLALAIALENHCYHINRPVYYIHSPEDLVCSTPSIKRVGDIGILSESEERQSGPLHEFLTRNQDKANPAILIVNYDNFEPDDIVRLNALLDEKDPRADGTEIKHAIVIGLINPNKPGCYQGEDFYSRFGVGNVETCSLTENELVDIKPVLGKTKDQDKTFPINLYHAVDWKDRLLGRWVIQGENLFFRKGCLADALNSGLPIEIQNGLWDDPSFCHFWNRARTLPAIESYNESFHLSESTIIKSEGYDWLLLRQFINCDGELKPNATVLNPSKLKDFFYRYQVNDLNQLETTDGWIKLNNSNTLDVNLTRALTDDEWAELLAECKVHDVVLNCHIAPSIILPQALEDLAPPSILSQSINAADIILTQPSSNVIESTDVDVTVCQLTIKDDWKVIDVSELNGDDLLTKLSGKVIKNDSEKLTFEFIQSDYILTKALSTKKPSSKENIILKGKISPELADSLATILLDQPENLRIITSDASNLAFTKVKKHEVSLEEKFAALVSKNFDPEKIKMLDDFEQAPFCKLQTKLLFFDRDPWEGLKGLSGNIKLNDFNIEKSKEIADEFIKERLTGIQNILHKRSYVFITGLTGVGKSTFIEKYLGTKEKPVFMGEEKINEWINNESGGYLFIDEANITTKEWSQFYGLLNDPPAVLIDGDYRILKNHYVIFAGNPFNYGGERNMSPLFDDNGVSFVFKPMPLEFIYEAILKPIFENTILEFDSLRISLEILKIYQFICRCSTDEVLISPRELQMIALLVVSFTNKYGELNYIDMTQYYSIFIARNLVPTKFLHEFDKQFRVPEIEKYIEKLPKDFVITPSREPLYQYLGDLIALREYRVSYWAEIGEKCVDVSQSSKLYGGLGGIVIEGDPGIGKSEVVIAHLVAHGYEEVKPNMKVMPEKPFYRIEVSMDFSKKEKLLLKAFDEGAIVIMDEINSSPMMERLLNALLMGKKLNGDRPKKPGFMIIGTQNPVTMAGRCKPSNAQQRRMTTIELPLYPEQELEDILVKLGVMKNYAKQLVNAFTITWAQAKMENASLPTFRDLKRVAENWVSIQDMRTKGLHIKSNNDFYIANNQYKTILKNYENILHDIKTTSLYADHANLCLEYATFIEKTSISKPVKDIDQLIAKAIYSLHKGIELQSNDNQVRNIFINLLKVKSEKRYVFNIIKMLPTHQQIEVFQASLRPGTLLESFFAKTRTGIFKADTPNKIREYLNQLMMIQDVTENETTAKNK